MSKETGVMLIGIWVGVLPFLGFPESWRMMLFVLTGLGLIAIGLALRSEILSRRAQGRTPIEHTVPLRNGDVRLPAHETEGSAH